MAHVLPALATGNVSLAAATLRAAADIAVASVHGAVGLAPASGAITAAHARAAAVMSLITSHGHLLHALSSEESVVPAAQPAAGSDQHQPYEGGDDTAPPEQAQSHTGLMQDTAAAAAAASGDEAGTLPCSAEQPASTEEAAPAVQQDTDEPVLAVAETATEHVQVPPPEGQPDPAPAQHEGAVTVTAPDGHDASTAGQRKQQEELPQQAEQDRHHSSTPTGAAEARQHCLTVSLASAPLSALTLTTCASEGMSVSQGCKDPCRVFGSSQVPVQRSASSRFLVGQISLTPGLLPAGDGCLHKLQVPTRNAAGGPACCWKPAQGGSCRQSTRQA